MKAKKSFAVKTVASALLCLIIAAGCFEEVKLTEIKLPELEKAPQGRSYKKIKYPKLGDIVIPEVSKVTLDNGMKLFLLEDHELPIINVSAMMRTGSIFEPADKIGLASICGEVMRTGGTKTRTGDEIDEQLESIAATVETSIGTDSGSAYMSVLKEDVDAGLEILADVLRNPVFAEDKIELAKIRERSMIARRNDQPTSIAYREYQKLIYGADSVYAHQTEYATIDNISRDDLVNFHSKFFYPNNIRLAVWGDFDTEQMVEKIEKAFAGWQQRVIILPAIGDFKYRYRSTVNLVRKDDINQSNIFLGHIGCLMSDPDYFALVLMNRVLGQGFTSRLFRNVRSRMGLAYSAFGVYSANYNYPGVFYVGCQTKSETTVKAIEAMEQEIKKMTEEEVTDEELEIARESFLNSFVFNFDTKGEIIRRLVVYDYYDYPEDFLMKMKEKIEEVNRYDILQVAQRHLRPDGVQVLVVGRPGDFNEPLSALGTVNEIDITIPQP
jgi:zinc protease